MLCDGPLARKLTTQDPDAVCTSIVAALERRFGARRLTRNLRQVQRVPGLNVEDWPSD